MVSVSLMELCGPGGEGAPEHPVGRSPVGFDLPAKGDEAIPISGTFFTINLSPVLRD